MNRFSNNHFDLAIVDPPYGIGQNWKKDPKAKFRKFNHHFNDTIPGQEFFSELFRVSKNQIIWGANYYWNFLPPTNHLIVWDKLNNPKTQFGSAGELAWNSFTKYPLLIYKFQWTGCVTCEQLNRIHPHQKPVKLYEQCLIDFANEGDKILDTHVGSGSSRIAAAKLKLDYTGFEIDKGFFEGQEKRFSDFIQAPTLF